MSQFKRTFWISFAIVLGLILPKHCGDIYGAMKQQLAEGSEADANSRDEVVLDQPHKDSVAPSQEAQRRNVEDALIPICEMPVNQTDKFNLKAALSTLPEVWGAGIDEAEHKGTKLQNVLLCPVGDYVALFTEQSQVVDKPLTTGFLIITLYSPSTGRRKALYQYAGNRGGKPPEWKFSQGGTVEVTTAFESGGCVWREMTLLNLAEGSEKSTETHNCDDRGAR